VALVLEGKVRLAGAGGVRTEGGCEGCHGVGAPPIRTNHARQVGQLVGISVHTDRGHGKITLGLGVIQRGPGCG
jgi:hypothetical protein